MTSISIRHLRYFQALARHNHFGRAADECAVSQPALSLQMKEFEDILGMQLIERSGRQIQLTAIGRDVAQRASDILQAIEDLQGTVRASKGFLGGQLRIGVIPTIAPYTLPRFIKNLTTQYPSIDIRPREAQTDKLVSELLDGRLDAAVVALPILHPALVETALLSEEFVLVRPRSDAGKPAPGPERLHEMRLLLLEEGHCFRDQALSYCKMSMSPPRDLMEGSSLSTLVQMVEAGIGVTLIPEMAVEIETRSAAISTTRLSGHVPKRTVGMVWRKSNPLANQLKTIAQAFQRSCPPSAISNHDDNG